MWLSGAIFGACWRPGGPSIRYQAPARPVQAAGGTSRQPALYLSDNHATAIAEYQQDLPRPGTLTAYDVDAQAILDLANRSVREAIGIDDPFLRQPWKHIRDVEQRRPSSWDFVVAVASRGWHGLRVPSVQSARNEPGAVAVERDRRTYGRAHRSTWGFPARSGLLAKLSAIARREPTGNNPGSICPPAAHKWQFKARCCESTFCLVAGLCRRCSGDDLTGPDDRGGREARPDDRPARLSPVFQAGD